MKITLGLGIGEETSMLTEKDTLASQRAFL